MKIKKQVIFLETKRQTEAIDITSRVEEEIEKTGITNGCVVLFSSHSTASVVLNHNEPMLLQDIARVLYRVVPIDERYAHDVFELSRTTRSDGRSNGHSHCKNILLGASVTVPLENGKMLLGKKQHVLFVELDGGRKRDFIIQVMGE